MNPDVANPVPTPALRTRGRPEVRTGRLTVTVLALGFGVGARVSPTFGRPIPRRLRSMMAPDHETTIREDLLSPDGRRPIPPTSPRPPRLRSGRGPGRVPTGFGSSWLRAAILLEAIALAQLATSSPALAVEVGPRTFDIKLAGVEVRIPARGDLKVWSDGDLLRAETVVVGDLADVQAKAMAIARALPLPTDNCARDGANVVVDDLDSAIIKPASTTAVVDLAGRVTVWLCTHAFGQELKTKGVSDSVILSIPVKVEVATPTELRLRLDGPPSVFLGGRVVAAAASVFVGDVSTKLASAVSSALDAARVKAEVPSLPGLEASFEHAEFVQSGASLGIRIAAEAALKGETVGAILDRAVQRP